MNPQPSPSNAHFRNEQRKKTVPSTRYRKSQALRDLEKLYLEKKIEKIPNLPYPVGENFRDDTANGLTKAIIAYIRLSGGQAERISTTGRPIDGTKSFNDVLGNTKVIGTVQWIPGTGTNGSADISATIQGKSVKIEVKIGADRQSQAQKDYQQAIERAGGLYFIAKDFAGFKSWFDNTFKP